MKSAKVDYKQNKTEAKRKIYETKKRKVEKLQEQLIKLEVQATDKVWVRDICSWSWSVVDLEQGVPLVFKITISAVRWNIHRRIQARLCFVTGSVT